MSTHVTPLTNQVLLIRQPDKVATYDPMGLREALGNKHIPRPNSTENEMCARESLFVQRHYFNQSVHKPRLDQENGQVFRREMAALR